MKNKMRIIALCMFIVLSLGVLSSCSHEFEYTPERIYEKVNPSVVCVMMETTGLAVSGSGVFINSDGVVLTSYHVVQKGGEGRIILSDGGTAKIKSILLYDETLDLALLETDAQGTVPAPLSSREGVEIGEDVYAIGYPRAHDLGSSTSTFTSGIVSAKRMRGGVKYVQSTVDVTEGNSGGVLVDSHAKVVGIVASSIDLDGVDYMNLSVFVGHIREFAKDYISD